MLDGKRQDSARDFGRTTEAALRWDMPFYEACAYWHQARLGDAAQRDDLAKRAVDIFARLGATWHQAQAAALLNPESSSGALLSVKK
jgi:hypothetical protein